MFNGRVGGGLPRIGREPIAPSFPPPTIMSTYETEKEKASYHEDASPARVEQAFQHDDFDPVEHKRILRKIDWHLLPFVSLLYLLSFL